MGVKAGNSLGLPGGTSVASTGKPFRMLLLIISNGVKSMAKTLIKLFRRLIV